MASTGSVWKVGLNEEQNSLFRTLRLFQVLMKKEMSAAEGRQRMRNEKLDLVAMKRSDVRLIENFKKMNKLMKIANDETAVLLSIRLLEHLKGRSIHLECINLNLSLCYFRISEFELSLQCAFKALALNESSKAYYRVGAAYHKLDLYLEAESALVKAFELNTKDSKTKENIVKSRETALKSEGFDEDLVKVAVQEFNSIQEASRELKDVFSFKAKYFISQESVDTKHSETDKSRRLERLKCYY
ncbi:hypothetical protein HDE_13072 [Halotydeus destructor]|nr:hypothetical protein HDE_13072 [Halotydeus destructor]